jgi:hypothetical protein
MLAYDRNQTLSGSRYLCNMQRSFSLRLQIDLYLKGFRKVKKSRRREELLLVTPEERDYK